MTTGEAHQKRDPHRETREAQEAHTLIDALRRGQRRRVDEIDAELDAKLDRVLGGLDGRVATGLEQSVARR